MHPSGVSLFGGVAVVKDPYSNAGQGIYTITNTDELGYVIEQEYNHDAFIV